MQLVVSYFDPDKAAVAAEALVRARVPFEKKPATGEDGVESVEFYVDEAAYDRAAGIVEELEEILLRSEGRKQETCPECGSAELERHPKRGTFGRYEMLTCRKCSNAWMR